MTGLLTNSATMKDELVLIDTSVWISYFRRDNKPVEGAVERLLDEDLAATCSLVMAELIQGARDKKQIEILRPHFESLHALDESTQDWVEAGSLAFAMKKKGKSLGLADCFLAVVAKKNRATIYSLDKHFSALKAEGHVRLFGD